MASTGAEPGFSALFLASLEQAGLGRTAFARLAGCTPSLVTEVIKGVRKPPLDRISRWAELLHPADEEARLTFVRNAALTHAPQIVQEWIAELKVPVQTSTQQVESESDTGHSAKVDAESPPNLHD